MEKFITARHLCRPLLLAELRCGGGRPSQSQAGVAVHLKLSVSLSLPLLLSMDRWRPSCCFFLNIELGRRVAVCRAVDGGEVRQQHEQQRLHCLQQNKPLAAAALRGSENGDRPLVYFNKQTQ